MKLEHRPSSWPEVGHRGGSAGGARLLRGNLAKAEDLGWIGEILLDADHLGHAWPAAAETQQFLDGRGIAGHQCLDRTIDPVAHITGAKLSLFRIGDDGGLHFARAYDIDVGQRTMWWMGMVEH